MMKELEQKYFSVIEWKDAAKMRPSEHRYYCVWLERDGIDVAVYYSGSDTFSVCGEHIERTKFKLWAELPELIELDKTPRLDNLNLEMAVGRIKEG